MEVLAIVSKTICVVDKYPDLWRRRRAAVVLPKAVSSSHCPKWPGPEPSTCGRYQTVPAAVEREDLEQAIARYTPPILTVSKGVGNNFQNNPRHGELGYSVTEQFVRDRLTEFSSSVADIVLIADCGGQIGGFLSFHMLPMLHVDGNPGRITALAVSSRFRRCGIRRKLIAAAEEFAWDHRCVRVEITSGDHRAEAHAFYEAVGYRQETRRFLKSRP
jgi:GNAT superfamily N-acetyltransferase